MNRKLSSREWVLLGVLVILVVVAVYVMLFYTPTINARDAALAETESYKDQTLAAQVRLAEKQRMERELDELSDPRALADYNNLQPVMVELGTILENTQYRCMLNDVTISGGQRDGSITVSGSIVFFECK